MPPSSSPPAKPTTPKFSGAPVSPRNGTSSVSTAGEPRDFLCLCYLLFRRLSYFCHPSFCLHSDRAFLAFFRGCIPPSPSTSASFRTGAGQSSNATPPSPPPLAVQPSPDFVTFVSFCAHSSSIFLPPSFCLTPNGLPTQSSALSRISPRLSPRVTDNVTDDLEKTSVKPCLSRCHR
jgi:hypothetical protein